MNRNIVKNFIPAGVLARVEENRELVKEKLDKSAVILIGDCSSVEIISGLGRYLKSDEGAGKPVLFMDIASAEMTKYAANAMLATRITFMNEIANLCEKVGANVDSVRRGIGSDPRIGASFLFPGPGYGGSCFPKDVKALLHTSVEMGAPMQVLRAVEDANEVQKHRMVTKLREELGEDLAGRRVALWGALARCLPARAMSPAASS